jgi:hypothetical protein
MLRGRLYVTVMQRPSGLTRRLQPAQGDGYRNDPIPWHHGFALRLPGERLLLVARCRRDEPLQEFTCPACGAVTRARMADEER